MSAIGLAGMWKEYKRYRKEAIEAHEQAKEADEEAIRVVFDENPAKLRSDKTRRRDPYGRSEFER